MESSLSWDKRLSDNTIKYYLYPKVESFNDINKIREYLNQYITDIFANLAKPLTKYLWHYQCFQLKCVITSTDDYHICGETNFGDNIEDEWFIVYLLFELTKIDDSLVVKVEDNDGDFLLIEAAEHLPKGLEPENSENRCFIYRNSFHIIPLKEGPFPVESPNIKDAVNAIRQFSSRTKCKTQIQSVIANRINKYPEKIEQLKHKVHCYVPIGVAQLLENDPSLVSHAVRAFYLRDPIDMKVCKAMKYFPPENRVMRTVRMTRCLYAQLIGQKFRPDIKVGWNMPPVDSRQFKAHDLGVKLACGFEILVAESGNNNDNNNCLSSSDENDYLKDNRWERFVNSLERNGYFSGEMNGSKRYNELFENAKIYFSQTLMNDYSESDDHSHLTKKLGQKILNLLKCHEIDDNYLKDSIEEEDDDQWLNCDYQQFDSFLSQKFSNPKDSHFAHIIPSTLKDFIRNENSGLIGAEPPVRPPRTKKKSASHSVPINDVSSPQKPMRDQKNISFNAETFGDALNTVLSLNIPNSDSDSSSSGMSDYDDSDDKFDSDDSDDDDEVSNKDARNAKCGMKEMKSYMELMDQQILQTNVGKSFELNEETRAKNDDNENHNYKSVNVDLTVVKNILESYKNEDGSGPASTLFASMGVNLPDDDHS